MAQLLVRNLDETLVRRLKKRAGEHGVSMEEEHRRILMEALTGTQEREELSFKEHILRMPDVEDDSLFARDRTLPDRATELELFKD